MKRTNLPGFLALASRLPPAVTKALLILISFLGCTHAAALPDSGAIDMSGIHFTKVITQNVRWVASSANISLDNIPYLDFSARLPANSALRSRYPQSKKTFS